MRKTCRRQRACSLLLIAASTACLLLSGCASTPEAYYTLSPSVPSTAGEAQAQIGYRLALGPVRMPAIVDRPEMVVRRDDNRVDVLDLHRWAAPLRNDVARVLAEDLRRELPAALVLDSGDPGAQAADYAIAVAIEQFDAHPGDAVSVQANWTVRIKGKEETTAWRATVREPLPSGDHYDQVAAAYSRALALLSVEIAKGVTSLQEDKTRLAHNRHAQ